MKTRIHCSRRPVADAVRVRFRKSAWRFAQRSGYSMIAFVLMSSSAIAQADAEFAKANQQFAQGDFKDAIAGYEGLVRTGQASANTFYDLGNAYFRAGDFGRAILNYQRALEIQPGRAERYLHFASVNQYGITATVAFWIAVFCLTALIFARRRSAMLIFVSVCCLLALAISVFAIYILDRGTKGQALAIVTGKDVQARLATADTAKSVLALPPGSEIKILSTRGDWTYAALPNDLRGWIPAKDAERVRL